MAQQEYEGFYVCMLWIFTFEEQACISKSIGFGCEAILSLKVRWKIKIEKTFSHLVLFVSIEG